MTAAVHAVEQLEPDVVDLHVPATAESLALVRLALSGIAGVVGAPSEAVADLKLAVTEACTNVVEHAYPDGDNEGNGIAIRYSIEPGAIAVEVRDRGVGFTPTDVEPKTFNPDGTESGMGLGIVRAITEDIELDGNDGGRVSFRRTF